MNTQVTKWDPIKELNQVGHRLSTLFSGRDDLPLSARDLSGLETAEWNPAVDISEDDNEYLVIADLPEVKKEEVKVGIENGILTIAGERSSESEEKDEKRKYHRVERSYGSYKRTFRLPDNIEENKIKAEFNDGVLRVHLPKCEAKAEKTIKVS